MRTSYTMFCEHERNDLMPKRNRVMILSTCLPRYSMRRSNGGKRTKRCDVLRKPANIN